MGYTYSPRYQMVDIVGDINTLDLSNVAGDKALLAITTPDFQGTCDKAYLMLKVHQIIDTSGAANFVASEQHIQLEDPGSVYRNAIKILADMFYVLANNVSGGTFEVNGFYDLSSYMTPNQSYNIKWASAESNGTSLLLYGCQPILRLYFGGY